MSKTSILRIAQVSAVIGILIFLVAFGYMFDVGVRSAEHVFHRLRGIATCFVVVSAIIGLKYSAIDWRDRSDKQWKLRAANLLIIVLVIGGIAGVIGDWFVG